MTARNQLEAFGLWMSTPNIQFLEMGVASGFETFVLDVEHGVFDVEKTDALIAIARAFDVRIFAKVPANSPSDIQNMLDRGVHGLIIAHIDSVAHAQEVTALGHYPAKGVRSFDGGRTAGFGGVEEGFFDAGSQDCLILPMIETATALQDVEKIAELSTVDGLFIGPYDLSLTSGRGRYSRSPADAADLERIAAAASHSGKQWWMPSWTLDEQQRAIELGVARMIVAAEWGIQLQGIQSAALKCASLWAEA